MLSPTDILVIEMTYSSLSFVPVEMCQCGYLDEFKRAIRLARIHVHEMRIAFGSPGRGPIERWQCHFHKIRGGPLNVDACSTWSGIGDP